MTDILHRLKHLATEPTIAPSSLYANTCGEAAAEIERLRDDSWKHGAECMRQGILALLPGGQRCDPQWIADMIRALEVPGR